MWKTLVGRCIYSSEKGTRVIQNPFFRWLSFANSNALQTVLNRFHPEKPGLHYINPLIMAAKLQPGSTCMLGLGGAGAAHALAAFRDNSLLTIVEKEAEIIDIAKRFFALDQLENINIIHQDASIFLEQSNAKFQHLLIDLYETNAYPQHCNTDIFFARAKSLLKPGGTLAVNLANRNEQWPIFQLIQKQFATATLACPVKNCANMIIFAQNSNSITPLLSLIKKREVFKRLEWNEKWGLLGELK